MERNKQKTEQNLGRLFVGVDIGGTTIIVGLVDEHGALRGKVQMELLGVAEEQEPPNVVRRVRSLVDAALKEIALSISDVCAVGVCAPGLLDVKQGIINKAANLQGWEQVPVCDLFAEALGVARTRVVLENDTNAALLAEVWIGAAAGTENALLMTLGTGIGGAIMCDGRILHGSKGYAGEVGHMILVPDGRLFGQTGVKGIFEGYASGSAIGIRAAEGGGPPAHSSLRSCAGPVTCKDVFEHAEGGDAFSMELAKDTARFLAIGCINICRVVDPEVIILSGGLSEAGEFLFKEVRQQYAAHHWNIQPVSVEIVAAATGRNSGLIGAARAAALRAVVA